MGNVASKPVQTDDGVASIALSAAVQPLGLLFSAFDLSVLARPSLISMGRDDEQGATHQQPCRLLRLGSAPGFFGRGIACMDVSSDATVAFCKAVRTSLSPGLFGMDSRVTGSPVWVLQAGEVEYEHAAVVSVLADLQRGVQNPQDSRRTRITKGQRLRYFSIEGTKNLPPPISDDLILTRYS